MSFRPQRSGAEESKAVIGDGGPEYQGFRFLVAALLGMTMLLRSAQNDNKESKALVIP